MITIELEINHPQGKPDLLCPVMVCDWCKQKITNGNRAMFKFRYAEGTATPTFESIVVLHKGDCDQAHTRKTGMDTPWNEATQLMGQLINNMGISWAYLIKEYCPHEQRAEVAEQCRS
jgi:hypothetical protein